MALQFQLGHKVGLASGKFQKTKEIRQVVKDNANLINNARESIIKGDWDYTDVAEHRRQIIEKLLTIIEHIQK